MTEEDAERLRRENDYLKQRCAQMQDDVVSLGSEVVRLQQRLEAIAERRILRPPNPIAGGQQQAKGAQAGGRTRVLASTPPRSIFTPMKRISPPL